MHLHGRHIGEGESTECYMLSFPDIFNISHPNDFTLGIALPQVLSDTPAKREVNRMNGPPDMRRTDAHT